MLRSWEIVGFVRSVKMPNKLKIINRLKCGCKQMDKAGPVTLSTIVECKKHREQRERYRGTGQFWDEEKQCDRREEKERGGGTG